MPIPSTTPSTTYAEKTSWYGGRKAKCFTQRVECTHGAFQKALGFNVPAYARVIAAHIRNTTVATITGTAAGATANSIALVMFPVSSPAVTQALTAAVSTATVKGVSATISTLNGGFTNGCIVAQTPGIGTSETNGVYRGAPIISRVNTTGGCQLAENANPVEAYLALVPALLSSNTIAVNATDSTAGFLFGTTTTTSTVVSATVDVVLYTETYDDYPT